MEKINGNMFYNSGWRALLRENDVNTDLHHEKSVTNDKKPIADNSRAEEKKADEKNTLLMLAKISADIGALNHLISEQGDKMDRLLSMAEEGKASDKKEPSDVRKAGLRRHFPFLGSNHTSE